MPFPEVKRVIYERNPLEQVICQLQFPAILRIETELPAAFQEGIRGDFPDFSEVNDVRIEFPGNLPSQIPPELIRQAIQSSAGRNYQFSSADSMCKVNLTRRFIALTSMHYTRWEGFRERLAKTVALFCDQYKPGSFGRIGLRYVNVIKRSALGLASRPWHDLIAPHVCSILAIPEIEPNVRGFETGYEVQLSDPGSVVRISAKFVQSTETGETCFMIDNDFYSTTKHKPEEVFTRLDYFNSRSSRLFQWCITPLLHNSMGPVET